MCLTLILFIVVRFVGDISGCSEDEKEEGEELADDDDGEEGDEGEEGQACIGGPNDDGSGEGNSR